MKNVLLGSALALTLAASANAAVFGSPTLALFPVVSTAVLGPLVTAPLASSVVDDAGNFAATLTSTVHSGGSNPLGGLTFAYTVSNDPNALTSPNDDIYAFAVRWDPAYKPLVIDVDSVVGLGILPFSFAYGPNGISFSFNFVNLPEGASSITIAIGTAAPLWTTGDAGIINGTTEDATALVPVPEPSTYALLAGLGLVGFAGYRRFRR